MFRAITLILVLLTAGCSALPEKAIATTKATAAGNDRYTELAIMALEGKTDLKQHGIASVSTKDLAATPKSVRGLVNALLQALHVNRVSAHSVLFQINEGPDPEKLGLSPIRLPSPDDDLLKKD